MKAFMSDRGARRIGLKSYDAATWRIHGGESGLLAGEALSEARRILSETELGDRGDIEHVRIPETRYFKRKARKDAETRSLFGPYLEAHAALTETLRAFVSGEALTPDTEGV